MTIDFRTEPSAYRHWELTITPPIATLALRVDVAGGIHDGYDLKMNSYDLGVDIELRDAVDRLRLSHPDVAAVILTSADPDIFCAGANITMLALASHPLKVNFCKLTNETRNAIEQATSESQQTWICAINGPASGGGYELALACAHLILVDDQRSAVSLPEVPLLGVLPGTGGLTRVVDKRGVRRDRADFLATTPEGVKGQRAVDWRLVDEVVPRSSLPEVAHMRAMEAVARSDRPAPGAAATIPLPRLDRSIDGDQISYPHLTIELDRDGRAAHLTLHAPIEASQPTTLAAVHAAGADWWPLALGRALDDAILHLRMNELQIGTWVLRTTGDPAGVRQADDLLEAHADDWFVREVRLLLTRTFSRLDLSARSLIALVEPGSCTVGTLAEPLLACDRSFMLTGVVEEPEEWPGPASSIDAPAAAIHLTAVNDGTYPMCNGLSRLATRFWGDPDTLATARAAMGRDLDADAAVAAGLVTSAYDDIDWPDETRLALETRASLSPDALTGMEANLRFPGPETMETKIFGRLTAWQNWIFQRPNAAGPEGALRRYATGLRPTYDSRRV